MEASILKHPVFSKAEDFSTICKPLKWLGITYFAHVYINDKQQYSATSNNPKYAELYVSNRYYDTDIHTLNNDILGNYVLWDALALSEKAINRRREASQVGVNHTFTIIEKGKYGNDFYHFGCDDPNDFSINQVYLANLDLLKTFIEYYKDTMKQSKELSGAYHYKFDIDINSEGFQLKNESELLKLFNNRIMFLHEISKQQSSKKILLNKNEIYESTPITPQQLNCLSLLASGKSAKEIAKILNLSPRTVDHYLQHLRTRLKCKNSKELISLYYGVLSTA